MARVDESSWEERAVSLARSGDLDGLLVMSMSGYDINSLRKRLLCWMLVTGGEHKFNVLKDYLDNKKI